MKDLIEKYCTSITVPKGEDCSISELSALLPKLADNLKKEVEDAEHAHPKKSRCGYHPFLANDLRHLLKQAKEGEIESSQFINFASRAAGELDGIEAVYGRRPSLSLAVVRVSLASYHMGEALYRDRYSR